MSETLREAVARAIHNNECWAEWKDLPAEDTSYGTGKETRLSEADFALKAIHQWLTEHGYAVVPREATKAMGRISYSGNFVTQYEDSCYVTPDDVSDIWKAMLSAAPASPLMEEGK